MPACRSLAIALLPGALLLSGCGECVYSVPGPDGRAGTRAVIAGGDLAMMPLGASEGEVIEEVDTSPGPVKGGPAAPRKGAGITARGGLFMAGGAKDVAFAPSFVVGGAYEMPFMKSDTLAIEAGVDFSSISNEDEDLSANMILVSASARFSPGGGAFYIAGSGTMLIENYDDGETGEAGSNTVPLVGVGGGLRPPASAWDARLAYHLLVGSQNLTGLVTLTGGYVF